MQPITLGTLTIRKFVESAGRTKAPTQAFGGISAEGLEVLQQTMDPRCGDFAAGFFYSSMHSYVMQTGQQNILIDTCNGNDKIRTGMMAGMNMLSNDYLGNLASLGLTPEDIDVVLCTHLHTDHVGWNTRLSNGSWVPTFPNARYLMSELDVEYYGGLAADHPQYMFTREAYDDSVVPVLDSGQAELVATDHVVTGEVGNGVWMEGAPGHTPGSMLIHAQSGGAADKHAIFSGDVFHHPVQIQDPEVHLYADDDAESAVKMRREFIATYADEPAIVLAAHFPDPTAGRIIRHDRGATFAFLETM